MKIYINRKLVKGPWGGGNRTIKTLHDVLIKRGHLPVYDFCNDMDLIYCHDPRPDSHSGVRYEHLLWLKQNKNIPIFQRVGDVFCHRGKEYTDYLSETIKHSSCVSFITDWAAEYLNVSIDNQQYFVHELKPPETFFQDKLSKNNKIRIITHHWSTNPLKGFDFYMLIDKLLEKRKDLEFFYLGRTPDDFKPKNIRIIETKDVEGVKKELASSDIYVTASKLETGGNHVVEALASNLPVLFHEEGGGICSLSRNYGYAYDNIDNFEEKLDLIIKNIHNYKDLGFEGTLEDTCETYCDIMENLINIKTR